MVAGRSPCAAEQVVWCCWTQGLVTLTWRNHMFFHGIEMHVYEGKVFFLACKVYSEHGLYSDHEHMVCRRSTPRWCAFCWCAPHLPSGWTCWRRWAQSPRAPPAVGAEFVYCFGYQAILPIRAPDVSPVCSLLRWHFNIRALWFQCAVSFTDWIKSWANERETSSELQAIKSTVSNLCFVMFCFVFSLKNYPDVCTALCSGLSLETWVVLLFGWFSLLFPWYIRETFAWQVLPMLQQHFIVLRVVTRSNERRSASAAHCLYCESLCRKSLKI